jgi:hypothetical protein
MVVGPAPACTSQTQLDRCTKTKSLAADGYAAAELQSLAIKKVMSVNQALKEYMDV